MAAWNPQIDERLRETFQLPRFPQTAQDRQRLFKLQIGLATCLSLLAREGLAAEALELFEQAEERAQRDALSDSDDGETPELADQLQQHRQTYASKLPSGVLDAAALVRSDVSQLLDRALGELRRLDGERLRKREIEKRRLFQGTLDDLKEEPEDLLGRYVPRLGTLNSLLMLIWDPARDIRTLDETKQLFLTKAAAICGSALTLLVFDAVVAIAMRPIAGRFKWAAGVLAMVDVALPDALLQLPVWWQLLSIVAVGVASGGLLLGTIWIVSRMMATGLGNVLFRERLPEGDELASVVLAKHNVFVPAAAVRKILLLTYGHVLLEAAKKPNRRDYEVLRAVYDSLGEAATARFVKAHTRDYSKTLKREVERLQITMSS